MLLNLEIMRGTRLNLCHNYLTAYTTVLFVVGINGLLPQVHQEGILRPFRSYADVTLFHYYVPKEASVTTFEFAAFMDSPKCPVREVFIYLQHGSYPVMSADNASFPDHFAVNRTSLSKLTIRSAYKSHDATVFPIYNPLPGSWFASAYLNSWDQKVQQEGLGHKCRYSLGSVALWSQVSDITIIPIQSTITLISTKHFTYYKFYVPTGVNSFTLKLEDCHTLTSRWFAESQIVNLTGKVGIPCIHSVFIRERALPFYLPYNKTAIIYENAVYSHMENLPSTDSYYYVMIVSESRISYNITISINECPTWTLGKSLIQQFVGMMNASKSMKDQVLRMNVTNASSSGDNASAFPEQTQICPCVPIFRLTRIKHPQDFSDTFLLEGKEWFTTWLALTDSSPLVLGTSFELLPYVDIGGTLNVAVHFDELILNATKQIVHVEACIQKSRPPGTFCCAYTNTTNSTSCCESGLYLHVSSRSLSEVNDIVYIPYPEPDTYYISFRLFCEVDGTSVIDNVKYAPFRKVIPCDLLEALISLDIRTQPCILSSHSSSEQVMSPCGPYGYCQEVHKGQFFYTACRCIGGYRGWGCTDGTQATPEFLLLMTTLLLTLSNLFFIPAVFLALRRKMFSQALIYCCTMISSILYHACDQDIYGYCLTKYSVLQFCDFFCSILAFWVTLIAMARSPQEYDAVLYLLGSVVIAIGVEYNPTGLMVFVVPFAMGFAFVIIHWLYRSFRRRAFIKPKLSTMLLLLPGVLLGVCGLILFAFVETEDNYRYIHSAWHAIIAISLLYLLPKKKVAQRMELSSTSAAELAPVNHEFIPQSSSSPVFFITSELDHLVQDQNR